MLNLSVGGTQVILRANNIKVAFNIYLSATLKRERNFGDHTPFCTYNYNIKKRNIERK